jgi:hypothetical protein
VQGPLHPSLERTAPDAFVRRVQRQGVVNAWDDPNFAIGEETSRRRMERAGVWLTSTNTMVAELVGNWAPPQGMALVPLLAADPPMLPVY